MLLHFWWKVAALKSCSDALKSFSTLTGLLRIFFKNFSCFNFRVSKTFEVVNFPGVSDRGLPRMAESSSRISD